MADALGTCNGVPAETDFSTWTLAALNGAMRDPDASEISLRIAAEEEMAKLNAQFRGKTGPTNVLSFPYASMPGVDSPMLGDVVICAPVVAREAEVQGKTLRAHWAHMVVHGILHLCGYDHARADEAAVMESLETRILGLLGFEDPYGPYIGGDSDRCLL